jgi:Ribbon-helix-helix protein, copG family
VAKIVKNFTIDEELVDALMRKSVARKKSMSLILREALRAYLRDEIGAAQ